MRKDAIDAITESFNTPSFWKQYEDSLIANLEKSRDIKVTSNNLKRNFNPTYYNKNDFIKLVDAELLKIKRNNKLKRINKT